MKIAEAELSPTAKILKQEIICRALNMKVRGKIYAELVEMLLSDECNITNELDIKYILEKERELRNLLVVDEAEVVALGEDSRGPNISGDDYLRFVEAMLTNGLKSVYQCSQDILTRSGLDSRNNATSSLKVKGHPNFTTIFVNQ